MFIFKGKPSRGSIHPDYVPSIFTYHKPSQVTVSPRYLRSVYRSKKPLSLREKKAEIDDQVREKTQGIDDDMARADGEREDTEMDDDTARADGERGETEVDDDTARADGEREDTEMDDDTARADGERGETEVDDDTARADGERGETEVDDDMATADGEREDTEMDDDTATADGERGEIQDTTGMNGDTEREMIRQSLEFNDDTESLMAEKEFEIGYLQIINDVLNEENINLKEENVKFKEENMKLKKIVVGLKSNIVVTANSLQKCRQGVLLTKKYGPHLDECDSKVCFYTGLPTYKVYYGLFKLLEQLMNKDSSKSSCSLFDEFLLVLTKLRLGIPSGDLAYRADISTSYMSQIFQKWINLMSVELKCLVAWPDPEKLRETLPCSFKKHYANTVCIVDCFEIYTERPVAFEARAATYSNYKKHNTVKVFIAITPTGSISFISQAWGGRVSDKEITQKCGFLDLINFGDCVMADRGFNIADDLALCGAHLVIPAFTRGKSQLPQQEVEKSRQIARVRIHVERVIGQLRKKYRILKNTLPVNLIKCPSDRSRSNCMIDRILIVAAALTNLSNSIVT